MSYFLVKTECAADKVDELTRKVANSEIPKIKGNLVFVSPDGRIGYDIIEAESEDEVRRTYQHLTQYCRIHEITPIVPMGQYIERWKCQHGLRM